MPRAWHCFVLWRNNLKRGARGFKKPDPHEGAGGGSSTFSSWWKPGVGIRSFAHFAQIKWVTVSDSLRSLKTNERPWANCNWAKHERFTRKTNERIPSPGENCTYKLSWLQVIKKFRKPYLSPPPLSVKYYRLSRCTMYSCMFKIGKLSGPLHSAAAGPQYNAATNLNFYRV